MIRHTLALLLGLATVVVVNKLGPAVFERLGFSMPGHKPVTTNGDLAVFLVYAFIAGFLGAVVIGLISRPLHLAPVLMFLAIGLVLDGLAVLNAMAGFPAWFRIVFVGSLPLQVWLGVEIGGAIPLGAPSA